MPLLGACGKKCILMLDFDTQYEAKECLMAAAEDVKKIFPNMVERFRPEKAAGIDATILFDLSGDNGGLFWFKINGGTIEHGEGGLPSPAAPAMTLKASADDWHAVATGQQNAMQAFMSGKIKIIGDMSLAVKLQTMFTQ